jgi:hypothetical protein
MQYEVKESGYGVTITSAKFDVVITPEAPLNVAIGESARMEIPQAINYIKSGEAEIKAATDIGVSRISSTVTDGLNQYNANATAKTTAYNDNATDKLSAYNLNAQNLTTAFDTNAGDKTTAFNNNATSKTGDFNTNATNKTNAFNQNATDKTTAFNDNAATKQAAVDASAAEAKQWAIGDPSEPTGNSAKYWANQAASSLSGLESRVTTIESEIPAQASSSNQLADKNFVNSSIATNTANFIGTFNSVAELEAYSGAKDDNDYAFVISTDAAGNTLYNRYKWNGTAWLFEYALNNSSFTANQWAAINSGATTTNIGQIATKADDNAVVHKTGNETITGTKTFTGTQYLSPYTIITKGNGTGGNDEGGELEFEIGTNSVLLDNVHLDVNNNSMRIFGTDSNDNVRVVLDANIEENKVKVPTQATSSNDNTVATTAYVKNVLSALYPVGSIYIGTQSTCPLATLINGSTWELISAGRVLQGADSGHAAGTTIEAGLPNITGAFEFGNISGVSYPVGATRGDGAFMGAKYGEVANYGSGSYSSSNQALEFYASRSNAIYGNSTTVQPPAYVVNVWRRTA